MPYRAPMAAFNRTRGTCLAENIRVAGSHWARLRGLIGTTESGFGPGKGLWIVPCHGVHTLAMRFPLDLIFLDRFGNVLSLEENVKPWRLAPFRFRAASVLELPGGTIRKSATAIGDKIEIVTANLPEEIAAWPLLLNCWSSGLLPGTSSVLPLVLPSDGHLRD